MFKKILLVVSLGMTTAATAETTSETLARLQAESDANKARMTPEQREQVNSASTARMLTSCASLYEFKGRESIAYRLLDKALDIDEQSANRNYEYHQGMLKKFSVKWGNPSDLEKFERLYNAEFTYYKCDVVLNFWGQ